MLSDDDILKADELPVIPVDVPEWGGRVYVATLRADERDQLEARLAEYPEQVGMRAYVCAFCICNEKGERRFLNELDVAAGKIGRRAAPGVLRVFAAADKANGITQHSLADIEKKS